MCFKPVELFIDISAVGNDHHFLFKAIDIELLFEVAELLLQALALITENRGKIFAHNLHLLFNARESLLDHFREFVALALASIEQLLDSGDKGFSGSLVQGVGIDGLLLKNAGPAHDLKR